MSSEIYQRVRQNPKFTELVQRRGRFAIVLSVIVLVAYYSFMMLVAFAPNLLSIPLSDGSALTVGTPIGAAIIIVSWLLTGLYVRRANGEFDRLNAEIIEEAHR